MQHNMTRQQAQKQKSKEEAATINGGVGPLVRISSTGNRRLHRGFQLSSWILMALIANQNFDPYADVEAVSIHRRLGKLKTMAKRERPSRERCIKLLTEQTGSENWNNKDWEIFDLCMHGLPSVPSTPANCSNCTIDHLLMLITRSWYRGSQFPER
eukprot:g30849.t1